MITQPFSNSLIVRLQWHHSFAIAFLNTGYAYHLWLPEWGTPGLRYGHSHNHLFTSTVLLGCLEADIYRVEPNPDGEWWISGKDTEGYAADRILVDKMKHEQGVTYKFGGPDLFHCVTHTGQVLTHYHNYKTLKDVKGSFVVPIKDRGKRRRRLLVNRPSMNAMDRAFKNVLR